jgi:hypothetical protein
MAELPRAGAEQSEVHFGDDSILMVRGVAGIVNGTTVKPVMVLLFLVNPEEGRGQEQISDSEWATSSRPPLLRRSLRS